MTGGESFDPSSPHFTDQAEGFINGQFKNIHFYKEDVMKNAVRTYHPGE
jgi:acyl-homoserine lactone acylase PvdQ